MQKDFLYGKLLAAMEKRAPSAFLSLFLLLSAGSIWATTTVGNFAAGEFTSGGVEGTAPIGANVDINFDTAFGPKSVSAPVDSTGHYHQSLPLATIGSTVMVASILCPTGTLPSRVVYAFNRFEPGKNSVVTVGVFQSGSFVSAGSAQFDLFGTFTAIDKAVDYDPSSITYGDLSGVLVASLFSFSGTGSSGNLSLEFGADQPYTVNLLPLWSAENPNGVSVPFSAPIGGLITVNSMRTPFSGRAEGSVAFFTDSTEVLRLSLNLTSSVGVVTGTLESRNLESLVPIPEPASFVLFLTGLLVIVLWSGVCRKFLLPNLRFRTLSGYTSRQGVTASLVDINAAAART